MVAATPELMTPKRFAVLGAGSWGTALAMLLADNGHEVVLWAKDPTHVAAMTSARCNERYLPDYRFPTQLEITSNLTEAVTASTHLLIVVPSHAFRSLLQQIKPLYAGQKIIWGTKGLDPQTGAFLDGVVLEELGAVDAAIISGPSFANLVAARKPTAVVVACAQETFLWDVINCFASKMFRVYANTDLIGVQLGGVIKNIMAIATGATDGLQLGANARSGLITRGLAEMMRLGLALGGRRETFMGLSGVGDLVLTCTDDLSRNRRFGFKLGAGLSIDQALTEIKQVVEGIYNVDQVLMLARAHAVEMPITEAVAQVLQNQLTPKAAVEGLMARTTVYE